MGPIREFLRRFGGGQTSAPEGGGSTEPGASRSSAADETKVCPECARDVDVSATHCRFCRHEFEPPPGAHGG